MTHPPLRPAHAPGSEPASPGRAGRARSPWAIAGLLAVIALGSGAYAMSTAGDEPATARRADPTAPASGGGAGEMTESSADTVVLERTGAEGVFVVTVTGLRCGVDAVGPAELRQRAKGQFCLVDVTAENAGREPQLLDGGAQRAVDARGRAYAMSDRAAVFLNDRSPTLLDEIAPGATVHGVLPFDVPTGTRLTALMLHAAPGSPGARVSLP